jgi:hypothetical protein
MKLDKNTRFVVEIKTFAIYDGDDFATLLKTEEKEVVGNECLYDIPAKLLSDKTKMYKTIKPVAVRIYKQSLQSKSMVELEGEIRIETPLTTTN